MRLSAREATPFVTWLKQRRRELDLTQESLAELLNCSVVTISKIEMGQRRPSKQIAELLANVLHVPVDGREDFLRFAPSCVQIADAILVAAGRAASFVLR